jgi:hypothetical protein
MLKFIEGLAKKRSMENGVSRFLHFVSQKFPAKKSYVGLKYMQDAMTTCPFMDEMTFMLALTLRHYLMEIYPLQVVESPKMKKKERLALLKKARTIGALLFVS